MKLPIFALAIALTMAFCTKEKTVHGTADKVTASVWPWYYWDYIGAKNNYLQMQDPTYYVLDDDQWPDCFNTMGTTYCTIKAMGDAWIEGQPDLNTVISWWYRPL